MSVTSASSDDVEVVTELLGRRPAGAFRIAVRRRSGAPVVIENAPHLDDGTPMPTLYWLIDPSLKEQVSRLESVGGVRRVEAMLDPDELVRIHDEHAARRTALIEHHELPAPSGGVGGTRKGLKCLHAHLASWLAGFDDPAGAIVAQEVELGDVVRATLGSLDDVGGSSL